MSEHGLSQGFWEDSHRIQQTISYWIVAAHNTSISLFLKHRLLPDTNQSVILHLRAENSFLLTVLDGTTGNPVLGAGVRLYNTGLGYDTVQYTNEKGQTYFIPLEAANYNLEVRALNYADFDIMVSVSGDNSELISLEQTD